MTLHLHVVIIDNMKAKLILSAKEIISESELTEIVVWSTPNPVEPSDNHFKYSLVYIVNGVRIVGFDNERGKGDHCHLDGLEHRYQFISMDQLVDDFLSEVDKRRRGKS